MTQAEHQNYNTEFFLSRPFLLRVVVESLLECLQVNLKEVSISPELSPLELLNLVQSLDATERNAALAAIHQRPEHFLPYMKEVLRIARRDKAVLLQAIFIMSSNLLFASDSGITNKERLLILTRRKNLAHDLDRALAKAIIRNRNWNEFTVEEVTKLLESPHVEIRNSANAAFSEVKEADRAAALETASTVKPIATS